MTLDTTTFAGLRIGAGSRIWLDRPVQINRYGADTIRVALADPAWRADIALVQGLHGAQAQAEAAVERLAAPGVQFLAWDWRRHGPQADPRGVLLGSATPSIHTLDADGQRLRVQGLPAGYRLTPGDLIGWQTGSDPVIYHHHRVLDSAQADAAGLTALFTVAPGLRPGTTTGTAVALVRPPFKAVVIGAEFGDWQPGVSAGARFSLAQVFR